MFENLPRLNGTATVEFTINGSSVVVELDGNNAPITAGNFVDLVQRDVYDGVAFHRVLEGFVVQGGDPRSVDANFPINDLGSGGFINPNTGERRNIPLEIKLEGDDEPTYSTELGRLADVVPPPDVVLEHEPGAIAMARSDTSRAGTTDTASSQFYFTLDEIDFLNGDYAVFGYITEGLEVLDTIERGEPSNPNFPGFVPDRITEVEVTSGLENFQPGELTGEATNTISLFRFRNSTFDTGTYLFVGGIERDSISSNSNLGESFELEGQGNAAFKASTVSTVGDDELLPFYRIRNRDIEGTYSFVSTEEYEAIFDEDSEQRDKWVKEGVDPTGEDVPEFYLYGVGAGQGVEFNRFQNNENGTFLFAGPEETAAINSDPNLSATFTDQGVAFESMV